MDQSTGLQQTDADDDDDDDDDDLLNAKQKKNGIHSVQRDEVPEIGDFYAGIFFK